MDLAALVIYLAFAGLNWVRVAIQVLRTGSFGLHPFPGQPGSVGWWAGILLMLGMTLLPLAPILAMLDVMEPIPSLDGSLANLIGLILASAGVAAIFLTQLAMGDSWRIGVEPAERTELVVDGPLRWSATPSSPC